DTLKQSSRYVSQYFNHAWESSGESNGFYHLAVTDALERRDIDLACRMLAEDIMAVKKEIQEMHFLA
ncbi:MAG: GntR family transcriptional regulator, partial [Hungatella sp.]